jgi:hypothetical protein
VSWALTHGFRNIKVATVSNDQPHTVKIAIDFLDGPHNDIVKPTDGR